MPRLKATIAERLAVRSEPGPNGCRLWTGPEHDTMGYGRISVNGVMTYVHRAAWEDANGPVPDGLVVRHVCDTPQCINLDHLTLGTQKDNVADMINRHRIDRRGQRNNSARLTLAQVTAIRTLSASGVTGKQLAQSFKVSTSQISNILQNRHWKGPNMPMTLNEAIAFTGKEVLDHLDRQAAVPVVTNAGIQGDVSILRVDQDASTKPIPTSGIVVMQGESGGNTHSLHGAGFFTPNIIDDDPDELSIGLLTVPSGVDVLMSHPEHGALLIAPGTYRVGRQREQADVTRFVAD